MKRNALVSVCCALLFTNILVAANAKDIEGLIGKCANGDEKACRKLETVVRKLTDQALLAKIAVESRDADVRRAAVRKLTDQALLAKIAVEDTDHPDVRITAIEKLTDHALLAKIAIKDEDSSVRSAAIEKLTDQALLADLAVEDTDLDVRSTAVSKLTDQALLAKIAVEAEDPVIRAEAIAELDESNPAMRRLAGNLGALTSDTGESIARIRLAIQEPRIRNRLPQIVFTPRVGPRSQAYTGGTMEGESVTFVLSQAGETLVEKNWKTAFPGATLRLGFLPAGVHAEDLLAELLHRAVFTQDDLAELSSSEIPEVRDAAVWNLTDQALLAKITVEDKVPAVRQAAEQRLAQIRNNTK